MTHIFISVPLSAFAGPNSQSVQIKHRHWESICFSLCRVPFVRTSPSHREFIPCIIVTRWTFVHHSKHHCHGWVSLHVSFCRSQVDMLLSLCTLISTCVNLRTSSSLHTLYSVGIPFLCMCHSTNFLKSFYKLFLHVSFCRLLKSLLRMISIGCTSWLYM